MARECWGTGAKADEVAIVERRPISEARMFSVVLRLPRFAFALLLHYCVCRRGFVYPISCVV